MVSTRTPAPRELLDEVNERRVRRDTQGVLALCEECWSSYRDGSLLDPVGLAASQHFKTDTQLPSCGVRGR